MKKKLQHGGAEKASGGDGQNRIDPEKAHEDAPEDGAQQPGQRLHLEHNAVGGGQALLRNQSRDAGLDRGLIDRLNEGEKHHEERDGGQIA